MRVILHADMNSFYASVSLLSRPELVGQAVAVGGDESERRGVILARNQIAKEYGIVTAETVYSARQKCPDLVILPPEREKYRHYSNLAKRIYARLTPRLESMGPDEAWLDLSASPTLNRAIAEYDQAFIQTARKLHPEADVTDLRLFLPAVTIADELRALMRRETGLTISVGVSWNKCFAKMGSDHRKPDATTLVAPWNYRELIWPKGVQDMLYVGPATAKKLEGIGITRVGDLAQADWRELKKLLGKNGLELRKSARGEDDSPVVTEAEQGPSKSIGNSVTLPDDISRYEDAEAVFTDLAEQVSARLQAEGLCGLTLQIWLREDNFISRTRQSTMAEPSSSASILLETAMKLLREQYDFKRPLRALGLSVSHFSTEAKPRQISLSDLLAKTPVASAAQDQTATEVTEVMETVETEVQIAPETVKELESTAMPSSVSKRKQALDEVARLQSIFGKGAVQLGISSKEPVESS